MKKLIKRFWGVGLLIIILSSLFVAAVPVAAAATPNIWASQNNPGGPYFQLNAGSDVADIAVQGSGAVTYVVTGTDQWVYKSTNAGITWVITNATALGIMPTLVAVAPDDPTRVAVADATGDVMVSVNSGATFAAISPIVATNPVTAIQSALAGANSVKGITMSPTRLGANNVTVWGSDNGTYGGVFFYNLGAVVNQTWMEKVPSPEAGSTVAAVAYSTNYLSDLTMSALSENVSAGTGNVMLNLFNFSQAPATNIWNPADYPGFPVLVTTVAAPATINNASMALDPAFLGGESTLMNFFIGLDTNVATNNGIWRVENTTPKNLASGAIYSIAYDGTTLVAGQTNSTSVLRSLDPMDSSPTVTGSSTYKSPGGATKVNVIFEGPNIAAGTTGPNSAFAISTSSGAAFNDISMIDLTTTPGSAGNAESVGVSPDGTKVYYATDAQSGGNNWVSLWELTTG